MCVSTEVIDARISRLIRLLALVLWQRLISGLSLVYVFQKKSSVAETSAWLDVPPPAHQSGRSVFGFDLTDDHTATHCYLVLWLSTGRGAMENIMCCDQGL